MIPHGWVINHARLGTRIIWVVPLSSLLVSTRICTFLAGHPNENLHVPLGISRYPKNSQPFEENYITAPQNKHGTQKLLELEIFPGSMFVFGCGIYKLFSAPPFFDAKIHSSQLISGENFAFRARIAASVSPMHILLPKSALQQALLPKGSLAFFENLWCFIHLPIRIQFILSDDDWGCIITSKTQGF